MSTQKKLIILAVCVVVVILAVCGIVSIVNKNKAEKAEDNLEIVTEEAQAFYEANVAEHISGNKTLVVFFSWGGHTEKMADAIAMRTGAKSEILDPEDEYPIEYEACVEVAQSQKDSNARPTLKAMEANLDEYSTIFIGYPIWIEDMPMAVYSFLEGNDFSGKTIVPFTTSGSSGESGTFEKIRSILPTANVVDGYHCSQENIDSNNFIDEINSWVDGLGINF